MSLNFTVVFAIILGAVGSKHFANTDVEAKFTRTDDCTRVMIPGQILPYRLLYIAATLVHTQPSRGLHGGGEGSDTTW